MELKWDISQVKNADDICWQYLPPEEIEDIEDGWEPTSGNLYQRLNPKTLAIIMSSTVHHLNSLSRNNILEWIYRLDSLFDAGKSFLSTDTDEGEVPIRIRIEDLRDHLGLKTSVTNWTKVRFDAYVRESRIGRHLSLLTGL